MNRPKLDSTRHFVGHVRELVRGQAQEFIDELRPMVQSRSLRLDLSRIERIDASGLAALICLARDARKAGHEFTVVHPSRQVARMLGLVGLDRMLVPEQSLTQALQPGPLAA